LALVTCAASSSPLESKCRRGLSNFFMRSETTGGPYWWIRQTPHPARRRCYPGSSNRAPIGPQCTGGTVGMTKLMETAEPRENRAD
jgi:hypothetical protein